MVIPNKFKQFLDREALVVVAAKEHGVIYRIADGAIETVDTLENHEPGYSDNEGFFFKAAPGNTVIGGAPKESNDELYKKKLDRMIADELDDLIKAEKPELLYVFEPEHLKGRIVAELQKHPHLTVHTVRYGNYVDEAPLTIVEYINNYVEENRVEKDKPEHFDDDLKQSS